MIRRSNSKRRVLEARLTKKVLDMFAKYNDTASGYIVDSDEDLYIGLPKFSKEEIKSVQEAINANDISLCLDVIDNINETIDKAEDIIREIDLIWSKIDRLFDNFKSECANISPWAEGYDDRGDYCNLEDAFCPIRLTARYNEHNFNKLKELRDSILSCF